MPLHNGWRRKNGNGAPKVAMHKRLQHIYGAIAPWMTAQKW